MHRALTGSAVVDMHAHFVPRRFPDLADRFGTAGWPSVLPHGNDEASIVVDGREFRRVDSRAWDPRRRLEDMDRDGVDVQVVSPTPVFFAYDRAPGEAAAAARTFNDLLAGLAAEGDGRLVALGQVPLQDTDAACAELERCMAAGFAGVEVGTHVGAAELDSGGVVTFLQHCAAVGAAVFVHPWDVLGAGRLDRMMLAWTVGMPAETHLAIASLILGGAFDRLPASLRIAFAHGGGGFALAAGRLDNAWRRAPAARGLCELPPSAYLGRFYVDAAVFDPSALRLLVGVLGDDRVMLGTDYPFPLGVERARAWVEDAGLPDPVTRGLLGANAARFLGGGAEVA